MAQLVKKPLANEGDTRDVGSVTGLGRSLGEGNANLPQYSCLENSMDRGTRWSTDAWVHKESDTTEHAHVYVYTRVCVCI